MSKRLSKAAKELNVSIDRLTEKLASKGHEVDARPNTKITEEQYNLLVSEFQSDQNQKKQSKAVSNKIKEEKEALKLARKEAEPKKETAQEKETTPKDTEATKTVEEKKDLKEEAEFDKLKKEFFKEKPVEKEVEKEEKVIKSNVKIQGVKTVGIVDLNKKTKPKKTEAKPVSKTQEKTSEKPNKATDTKQNAEIKTDEQTSAPAKKASVIKAKGVKLKGVKQLGSIKDAKSNANKYSTNNKDQELIKERLKSKIVSPKKEEVVVSKEETPKETEEVKAPELIKAKAATLSGPKMTGQKIDLSKFNKPKKKVASSTGKTDDKNKKKRKRINKPGTGNNTNKNRGTNPNNRNNSNNRNNNRRGNSNGPSRGRKPEKAAEPTEAEIQKKISDTLSRLTNKSKNKGAKYRKSKRDVRREQQDIELELQNQIKSIQVTEFVTVNELATMMSVGITDVISSCMMLGLMVTMNQRLDAETLQIVAEEFGFEVEFVSADVQEAFEEEEDNVEDLLERAPIVTVMGHVDHGKTSLLDYIREANVIAGEAGGITQHIGSYHVEVENGKKITFIDTPGHEAFTAMRARGAKVTDVAIIVIAADDRIMPQTKEAIAHAQAAEVPMIFAINKVDKPTSNPDKIKEELASMNLLVEDWGGKYQSQDVSAKTGLGIKELLEKVLLESELLELKANPVRKAKGTIVEASLDKGKGFVTNILVQNGTLKIGDFILSGQYYGKVKAMNDERGNLVKTAGPSIPVSILGLNGAPQAGDTFNVMEDEREAKQLATKRTQLQREQSIRTQKHMTLDEIGRRLALDDFQELNLIVKGDVDGSIEALSDSLQKLSTESIQVNIIHKAVGQISDSDVLLAMASDAIIVGFQVRPSGSARKTAEKEKVEIRTYSIIYDAINEIKEAMQGMLAPKFKEEIIGNILIRETFKITKVGTIAGCYVTNGKITRHSSVRIIREGIVKYDGKLGSLKRFKDDVKEVTKGFECGLNIENYNDIKVDDEIEVYEQVEVKQTL